MKVKFSRKVEYIPEWKGNRELSGEEQIKVICQPMKMKDLLLTMDAFGGQGQVGVAISADRMKSIMDNVGHLVGKYSTIENLEDDDGPVTAQSISDYPVFLELAGEILTQLVAVSMPSEEARKN